MRTEAVVAPRVLIWGRGVLPRRAERLVQIEMGDDSIRLLSAVGAGCRCGHGCRPRVGCPGARMWWIESRAAGDAQQRGAQVRAILRAHGLRARVSREE